METKRIAKFLGLGIIIVILVAFVSMGFVIYDVMSYTATGSETLNPAGNVVGNALVVYNPGISGDAKNVAAVIAGDLQAKGYKVDLAGINSAEASTTSGYDVIIVGGPIYAGNASSSVKSYLNALKPSEDTKIGVFATGQDPDTAKDKSLLLKEAAPLPEGSQLKIIAVTKFISGDNVNKTAATFVDALLK
jgi:flavodoxin